MKKQPAAKAKASKPVIQIKHRQTGEVIFEDPKAKTLKEAVVNAVKQKVSLRSADLSYADLSYADLRYADLRSADLRSAVLRSADLSYADLSYAVLRYADLRSADLRSAVLRSADLSYAVLRYADLRSADLRSAVLRSADLSYADLSYADLSYADLSYADLSYAVLRYAKGIDTNGNTVPLTDADYLEIRDQFRKDFPEVPIVPALDATICQVVNSGKGKLDMSTWHSCKTTHCRAGWAIHLAGKAGYALEAKLDSERAGGMIYLASTGRRPDFFAGTEAALKDICEWGAKETAAPAQS
jgi:hypothetical protein